jgi:hypothetical protein
LPDLILPIGAKGLLRHTMMCCTLSSASTINARSVQHFINDLQRFTIIPNITNNWAQVVAKRYL